MNRIRTLFLLLTIVGPMHMAEQLLFGIEEFFSRCSAHFCSPPYGASSSEDRV